MSFHFFMKSPRSKKKDALKEVKKEVRYIFRISPSKLICAKHDEMVGHKMRFGSLADNYKIIEI